MTKKHISPEAIIEFMSYAQKLKKVPRAGWILKGIEKPESVSDHCHSTGMLAIALARSEGLDERKVALVAFLHDVGESIMGDIIWEQGTISNTKKQAQKHITEVDAIKKIFSHMKHVDEHELQALIVDFLEQKTPEARLVKDCDKLEMVFQALEYETQLSDPNVLVEFWENAAKYLKSETAWAVFEELKQRSKITNPLPNRQSPPRE